MAKCGSVFILTLTVISVGMLCFTLIPEGHPMEEKSERSKEVEAVISHSKNLSLHGKLLITKRDDTPGSFCNHTYTTIDAAMEIYGKVILFVDKGHVIDERDGFMTYVETRFPSGPQWVHAAVYSEKTQKAYLFKHDIIYTFELIPRTEFQLLTFSINLKEAAHDPECALQYFDYDTIYLMKRGYFYEFKPLVAAVVWSLSKLNSPVNDLTVAAAFSTNNELYFVIDHTVFKVPKGYKENQTFFGKERNFFFNKCEN